MFRHIDKAQLPNANVSCFCSLKNVSNEMKLLEKVALLGPVLLQWCVA